jgi:hypothetical protein
MDRQYNGKKMETIQWQKDGDNTMVKRWRQYNGKKRKDKKTNNDLQNTPQKTKD